MVRINIAFKHCPRVPDYLVMFKPVSTRVWSNVRYKLVVESTTTSGSAITKLDLSWSPSYPELKVIASVLHWIDKYINPLGKFNPELLLSFYERLNASYGEPYYWWDSDQLIEKITDVNWYPKDNTLDDDDFIRGLGVKDLMETLEAFTSKIVQINHLLSTDPKLEQNLSDWM